MEQNTRGEDEINDSTLSDSSSMNNETAVSNGESKGDNEVLEEQSQGFDNESNLEEQMNTSLHINEDVKIQDNYNINFEECNKLIKRKWTRRRPIIVDHCLPNRSPDIDKPSTNGKLHNNSKTENVGGQEDDEKEEELIINIEPIENGGESGIDNTQFKIILHSGLTTKSTVIRKLSDFYVLYRQLQSNNWGVIIPPPPLLCQLPDKVKPSITDTCRNQMQMMLEHILNNEYLRNDIDFKCFLNSDDYINESVKRANITNSLALDTTRPFDSAHISLLKLFGSEEGKEIILNGGIESEYKGLFSFSTIPTYKENDEYLIKAFDRISIIEQQFKTLVTSLTLIDKERGELKSVQLEYYKTLQGLADEELNKHCSEVIRAFARNHQQTVLFIDEDSVQEYENVWTSVDLFLRYCTSIRATLDQRVILGTYCLIVKTQLQKATAALEKLNGGSVFVFRSVDKKEQLEKTIQILSRRKTKIEAEIESITTEIKKNLRNFYGFISKIFMKNTEKYVDALLVTHNKQKESWENFPL